MSPSPRRVKQCTREEAQGRIKSAKAFLDAASLVKAERDVEEFASVIAGLAVLAGIAATDAICGIRLG